jgi:hypothetical protein
MEKQIKKLKSINYFLLINAGNGLDGDLASVVQEKVSSHFLSFSHDQKVREKEEIDFGWKSDMGQQSNGLCSISFRDFHSSLFHIFPLQVHQTLKHTKKKKNPKVRKGQNGENVCYYGKFSIHGCFNLDDFAAVLAAIVINGRIDDLQL